MKKRYSQDGTERVALTGILEEFRNALEDEIKEIEKSGQSSILLSNGQRLDHPGQGFWYRFSTTYVPAMPPDTPCKIILGTAEYEVTVVQFDDNSVIVVSNKIINESLAKARLENGSTILMEKLIHCIEENSNKENTLGNHLFKENGSVYLAKQIYFYDDLELDYTENNAEQNRAISAALTYDVTYIWGPPGTGKTTVIGKIVNELFKHNRSVLIVSHTNTAVDAAIAQADKSFSDSKTDERSILPYPILRLGTPSRQLPERVLLKSHIDELGAELYAKQENLEKQKADISKIIANISIAVAKYTWIKTSQIGKLEFLVTTRKMYKKQIGVFQERINNLETEKKKECAAHPEYEAYNSMLADLSSLYLELEVRISERNKTENNLNAIKKHMESVQEEIKKHTIYNELRTKQEKYKSLNFLKTEKEKADAVIASIDCEIKKLKENKRKHDQVLRDYENKNSLSRLFSSKKTFEQAKEKRSEIKKSIKELETEYEKTVELGKEYKRQIDEVELINAQLSALVPLKNVEYWKEELISTTAEFENKKQKILNYKEKIEFIESQIKTVNEKIESMRIIFNSINGLEEKLLEAKQDLKEQQELLQKNTENCLSYLQQESALVNAFAYKIKTEEIESQYEELNQLSYKVEAEIKEIDFDSLNRKKEMAESDLAAVSHELNDIQAKLQGLEKQVIDSAKIVGVTLVKSYISDILRQRSFDTVILDEASMAPIPALWCASYLAEKSLVIVGDFLQLPPIFLAETPIAKNGSAQIFSIIAAYRK